MSVDFVFLFSAQWFDEVEGALSIFLRVLRLYLGEKISKKLIVGFGS